MPSDSNDWAVLDELLGIDVADAEIDASKTFAFYGRVSTEDNQDPETSYGWQFGNAQKFAAPGLITQTYSMSGSRVRCHGTAGRRRPGYWPT